MTDWKKCVTRSREQSWKLAMQARSEDLNEGCGEEDREKGIESTEKTGSGD